MSVKGRNGALLVSNREQVGRNGRQGKAQKKSWLTRLVIDNTEIIEAAKTVPCIEVLDALPDGSRRFAGPFYPDEREKLCSLLKSLRTREGYIVAPGDDGLIGVYRRARAK